MRTVVILAMHGIPPNDFPRSDSAEFFRLGGQIGRAQGEEKAALIRRRAELDGKMRNWPRTEENDPYHAWSLELAEAMQKVTGNKVIAAFNEFCAPTLGEAIEQAISGGADRVVVVTAMMTRGGEHSEVEIPEAVDEAKKRYPNVSFVYAWPFDVNEVARFLAGHIAQFD
jgi:sirohydrochlorin cobaltochelatase